VSGRYLLDTNVVIAILESEIDLVVRRGRGLETFLNTIVLGELIFGAEKSRRVRENMERIGKLVSICPVFPCDEETARFYGAIKNRLQKKGRPIPENDIWIAASAHQHGLTLASRDPHFDEVEGLPLEAW
jgi:tRNA(fMet)-specific endonuclease VapC